MLCEDSYKIFIKQLCLKSRRVSSVGGTMICESISQKYINIFETKGMKVAVLYSFEKKHVKINGISNQSFHLTYLFL
jgi:hypothetical protein